MIKLSFLNLLMLLFLVSCNESTQGQKSGYKLSGQIFNAPNASATLEHITFSQATVIDSAVLDPEGKFEMQGFVNEKGLYLVKLNTGPSWLIVLENDELELRADARNTNDYSVNGIQDAEILNSYIKEIGAKQAAVQQITMQFNQARSVPQNDAQLIQLQQQYEQQMQNIDIYVRGFIDTVSSPLLAVFAANMLNPDNNFDYMQTVATRLKNEQPENPYVQEFVSTVNKKARLASGSEAPEISLKSPGGESLNLTQTRGNVVLLDFWASWCGPCRKENPHVVKLYEKYKDKGFTVFSVSLDQEMNKWVNAIQQDNLSWNWHVSDLKGWRNTAAQDYEVTSIPATFLLDKDGKIIGKNLRGAALETKLAELFPE